MSANGHLADRLSAYLDDELPLAERTAVESHLRECGACGQLLEELAAVDSAARSLPVTAPEGYFEDFPARVRGRLAARRVRRVPAWTWAAAAAVLLAVLTPLTMLDRRPAAAPAAQEPAGFARTGAERAAEATPAPPTTTPQRELDAFGYVGKQASAPEAKAREYRQQAGRLDDRLLQREADRDLGADGTAPGPGRRAAELKKESAAYDGRMANVAPPPATPAPSAPAPADAAAARPKPDGYSRAEPPAAPPPPASQAEATAPAPAAAKPQPAEGALRARTATGAAPSGAAEEAQVVASPRGDAGLIQSRDEDAFAEEFESLALARPPRTASEARAAARAWAEQARRHPQAKTADEARVRAIEALATAWRLERKGADRDEARRQARAYLAAGGPQKDRVRALVQALER